MYLAGGSIGLLLIVWSVLAMKDLAGSATMSAQTGGAHPARGSRGDAATAAHPAHGCFRGDAAGGAHSAHGGSRGDAAGGAHPARGSRGDAATAAHPAHGSRGGATAGCRFEQLILGRLHSRTAGHRRADRDCLAATDAKAADPLAGFVTMRVALSPPEPLSFVLDQSLRVVLKTEDA
jgi:hypothetical protein